MKFFNVSALIMLGVVLLMLGFILGFDGEEARAHLNLRTVAQITFIAGAIMLGNGLKLMVFDMDKKP